MITCPGGIWSGRGFGFYFEIEGIRVGLKRVGISVTVGSGFPGNSRGIYGLPDEGVLPVMTADE
jgi:hypothetical protein